MEIEKQNENQLKGGKKTDYEFVVQIVLIGVLLLLIVYNAGKLSASGSTGNIINSGIPSVSALDIIPKGVPEIYGNELNVKYDDVSASNPTLADATIEKLSSYENQELNEAQMNRYITIGSSISCEYCCGAEAIIFSNGQRACGCAHSYAMRGLAKYLLIKQPDMTDEEILSELGKWKVLFFPGIHEQKAQVLKDNNIDYKDYINLASNKYRGAEQGAVSSNSGGSMVGGC